MRAAGDAEYRHCFRMTTRVNKRILTNHSVAVIAVKGEKPNLDASCVVRFVVVASKTCSVSSISAASLSHCRHRGATY